MLWEGYQQSQIADAQGQAGRAMAKAERQAEDLRETRQQVQRLSLACQAMWELLRERTSLSEADLDSKILEIDARDGKIDGRISTQALTCHACGRPTNSKREFCVMCGAPLRRQHKFET